MNSVVSEGALIGIDWGTSSLRAYLLDAQGSVLDKLNTADGIMHVKNNDFEGTFHRLLDSWLAHAKLPVVASGMITSRNGWSETPYLPVPATTKEFASTLQTKKISNGIDVRFVSGASSYNDGAPDVMRGEETQIIGAVESGVTDAVFVVPGTHSKWVTVREGCIDAFATYMSGEVFAVLREHTILGKLMKDGEFSEQGFNLGVNHGFDTGSQLLHTLFRVRTLPLFDLLSEEQVSDYLSGMLIGAEIHGAINQAVENQKILIIGNDALSNRYAKALQMLGKNVAVMSDDIAAQGHFVIAKSANII